jgi:hypothetical protein
MTVLGLRSQHQTKLCKSLLGTVVYKDLHVLDVDLSTTLIHHVSPLIILQNYTEKISMVPVQG